MYNHMRNKMINDHMRNKMIDVLDELSKVNISQAPNYRMMVALRDAFVDYGLPRATAERLVASMKISVSEQAVMDEELVQRVCETYGVLVFDMYTTIKSDFENSADDVLCAMAGQISLKMEF